MERETGVTTFEAFVKKSTHTSSLVQTGGFLYSSLPNRLYRWEYDSDTGGAVIVLNDCAKSGTSETLSLGDMRRLRLLDQGRLQVPTLSLDSVDADRASTHNRIFDSKGEVVGRGERNEDFAFVSYGLISSMESFPDRKSGHSERDFTDVHSDTLHGFLDQGVAEDFWGPPLCGSDYISAEHAQWKWPCLQSARGVDDGMFEPIISTDPALLHRMDSPDSNKSNPPSPASTNSWTANSSSQPSTLESASSENQKSLFSEKTSESPVEQLSPENTSDAAERQYPDIRLIAGVAIITILYFAHEELFAVVCAILILWYCFVA